MRTWHTWLIGVGIAISACENKSKVYQGTEVFGVPAPEHRGPENAKLKEVLPPGVQELDLGMTCTNQTRTDGGRFRAQQLDCQWDRGNRNQCA
jgi:hypothetical protein